MEVTEALTWHGGVAEAALLRRLTSRRQLRTAVGNGAIVRLSRGQYGLPDAELARREAGRLSAVVSHLSAAQLNGWELKSRPPFPMLTVPRGRKVDPWRRQGVALTWRSLDEEEVWNGRTTAGRTVTDCSRDLPFPDALTVADSALRRGAVDNLGLMRLANEVQTIGRTQCLRVAREADGRAANPFESVLRSISLDVRDLALVPQVVIDEDGWVGRPDLSGHPRLFVGGLRVPGTHIAAFSSTQRCCASPSLLGLALHAPGPRIPPTNFRRSPLDVDRRIAVEADSFQLHFQRRTFADPQWADGPEM